MTETILLIGIAAIIGLWFENRTVCEIAVAHCRRACREADVQFLDDIAPLWNIRFKRNANGHLLPQRVFKFDYTHGAGDRRTGSITMLGHTPIEIQLTEHHHR